MIGVVIDSGADVNLVVYTDRRRIMISPIRYAIRNKKPNAVSYFLSRGADISPISQWPRHPMMYKALREQKMIREGGTVIEFQDFKAMSHAARATL
jgi:hypothetical protein